VERELGNKALGEAAALLGVAEKGEQGPFATDNSIAVAAVNRLAISISPPCAISVQSAPIHRVPSVCKSESAPAGWHRHMAPVCHCTQGGDNQLLLCAADANEYNAWIEAIRGALIMGGGSSDSCFGHQQLRTEAANTDSDEEHPSEVSEPAPSLMKSGGESKRLTRRLSFEFMGDRRYKRRSSSLSAPSTILAEMNRICANIPLGRDHVSSPKRTPSMEEAIDLMVWGASHVGREEAEAFVRANKHLGEMEMYRKFIANTKTANASPAG